MASNSQSDRMPVEAVRRALARLAAVDDPAIFISRKDEKQLLAEAERLAARGSAGLPLYGMVFAVKDNIDVAGLPTTAACPAYTNVPDRSAVVVAKLEAAGAIVLGKANLDQFATGLVGVRSPYGVPRNVLRADLVPGGSSSGSAVAVAAGIVDFALGTDTAGSGRIPAGMNGIVGLKPSLGLLSSTGLIPACRTLDTISVFARDVSLAAQVTEIASGYDAGDAYSRRLPAVVPRAPQAGMRIGVPYPAQRQFFGDAASEAAYEADLAIVEAKGGVIVPIDFEPLHAVARLLYEGPWVAERYAATRPLIKEDPAALLPVTRAIIEPGGNLSAVATFEAFYKLAALRRQAESLLSPVDCLAVPTVPRFYTLSDLEAEPVRYNSNLGTYTNFVNLLDLSAISLPTGTRSDGLPSSLTFIARSGQDGFLAGLALALEKGEAFSAVGVETADARIEIAVVGAHLSGLPLNHELTRLGGVYRRNVTTLPNYRLFALAGTVPPKPGLLRVEEGGGSPIEAEIWSLAPAAFGQFVVRIPSPLGIGTLSFSDGTSAKGFLVEAVATSGARDISEFGGWRAFLAAG